MSSKRSFIISSRVFVGLIIALGGFYFVLWCEVLNKGLKIPTIVFLVLLSLHLIGALSAMRITLGGILTMIFFTVLSLIALYYLKFPLYPPRWLNLLYLILICAQLVMLGFYLIASRRFTAKT